MKKQIKCEKEYLLLPIAVGKPRTELVIYADGEKLYEFCVPVSEGDCPYEFQYYAPVPLSNKKGSLLVLEGEVGDAFLEAICLSDSVPRMKHRRPALHFTANTGWINDPNGFYVQDGVYHLYFQYNPFDVLWGNMCWGHAVSSDLLHWEQQETVMYPDEDGTIYSGSAIINDRKLLGLPAEYPIYFYTCAGGKSKWSTGKKYVQKIAYSPDGGHTLIKQQELVVDYVVDKNRDPKVYWHEESAGYYMVLYLEGFDFAIFRSENLINWTMTQKIHLEEAWECPDLVRVPVEGGGSRWMFWCADGFYFLGDFDGYMFTPSGEKQEAYATAIPYAAQTCWGEERVISIPWIRSDNVTSVYTGAMGIPRELYLTRQGERLVLKQKLIREWEAQKVEIQPVRVDGNTIVFEYDGEKALEVVIGPGSEEGFSVRLGAVEISCNAGERVLNVKGCLTQKNRGKWRNAEQIQDQFRQQVEIPAHPQSISVLIDHEIMEITVDDGMVCAVFEIQHDAKQDMLQVEAARGDMVRAYQLS